MKYNNHLNYGNRKKLLLRLRIIYAMIALFLFVAVIYFFVGYLHDQKTASNQSSESEKTSSFIAPSINIFKTPFYQFQAPKSWSEIPNESNSSRFVYRSIKSNLIGQELDIYVDQIPANLEATRVLPANFVSGNTGLNPTIVSEHCIKALNGQSSSAPVDVNFMGVKFRCDSDNTNYSVLVGQVGDDSVLNMIRPEGTKVAYTIYYTNLGSIPDSSELIQMIKSFQTR